MQTRSSKKIIIDDDTNYDIFDLDYVEEIKPSYFSVVYSTGKIVFNAVSIYILWVSMHYLSSHLYVYFCTPNTLIGYLYSPFIVAAPHCRALRWTMNNGAVSIDNMWFFFGTWLCSKIILPTKRYL